MSKPGTVVFTGRAKLLRIASPSGKEFAFVKGESYSVEQEEWDWLQKISTPIRLFEFLTEPVADPPAPPVVPPEKVVKATTDVTGSPAASVPSAQN